MDLPAPWPKAISLRDTLSAAQGFFCRGERARLRTEELNYNKVWHRKKNRARCLYRLCLAFFDVTKKNQDARA